MVTTTDKGLKFEFECPGVDPATIDVEIVEKYVLSVQWEQRGQKYRQVYTISSSLDTDKTTSAYAHGLLTLEIPYREFSRSKVKVQGV